MWEQRPIEDLLHDRLKEMFGRSEGDHLYGSYTSAREDLVWEILPEIAKFLPDFTDHDEDHVARVLDKTWELLGEQECELEAPELYCLLLSTLFHDVGNIYDRDTHEEQIAQVYDYVRPGSGRNPQEKQLMLRAVGAHRGKAADGTSDTLKLLDDSHLFQKRVRLRDVAAVLRLADELDEGPRRTSRFMHQQFGYPENSGLHHEYARNVRVAVDRGNGRIAVTYHVEVQADGELAEDHEGALRSTLEFACRRITKLNQERQYARHYCNLLAPFRKTTVALVFWVGGREADIGLQKLDLTELVIPGERVTKLGDYDEDYRVSALLQRLKEFVDEEGRSSE